jgi:hypothetical protein
MEDSKTTLLKEELSGESQSQSNDLSDSQSSDSHSSDSQSSDSHSNHSNESHSDFSSDILAEASFTKKCKDKIKDAFSSHERIPARSVSSPLITKSSPELSPVLPRAVSYALSPRSSRRVIQPSVNRQDSRECLSREGYNDTVFTKQASAGESHGRLIKTNSFMRDYYDSFLITADGVCKGLSKLSTLEIVQSGFYGVKINDSESISPQDNRESLTGQSDSCVLYNTRLKQTPPEVFYILYSKMKMNAILIPSLAHEIEYSLEEILSNKSEWFPFYVKTIDMKYTEQDFKHVFLLLINTLKDNIGLKKASKVENI